MPILEFRVICAFLLATCSSWRAVGKKDFGKKREKHLPVNLVTSMGPDRWATVCLHSSAGVRAGRGGLNTLTPNHWLIAAPFGR